MAMKKVTGRLTAGVFANYERSVRHFVSNDEGFLFMNQIKGTPAQRKKIQGDVLAMVKQVKCETFLLTFLVLILDGMSLWKLFQNLTA